MELIPNETGDSFFPLSPPLFLLLSFSSLHSSPQSCYHNSTDIKEIHQHNNYRATKCASGLAQLGCLHTLTHTHMHIHRHVLMHIQTHLDTDVLIACASSLRTFHAPIVFEYLFAFVSLPSLTLISNQDVMLENTVSYAVCLQHICPLLAE